MLRHVGNSGAAAKHSRILCSPTHKHAGTQTNIMCGTAKQAMQELATCAIATRMQKQVAPCIAIKPDQSCSITSFTNIYKILSRPHNTGNPTHRQQTAFTVLARLLLHISG